MKFGYVESQKPTKDERSWVVVKTEAGIHINVIALNFDFQKKKKKLLKNNQSFSENKLG